MFVTKEFIIAWTPRSDLKAVRAEIVVRQAHHDRVFPSVLSGVEGQAQGER